MNDVQKLFGSLVFNETVMKDRLPTVTYKAYKQAIIEGKPLNLEIANIIANAILYVSTAVTSNDEKISPIYILLLSSLVNLTYVLYIIDIFFSI